MKKKILLAIGVVIGGTVLFGITANANPSFFPNIASSSTATTSPSYMTPGTATTTVISDSYGLYGTNQTVSYNSTKKNDSAVLKVQFTASSTSSILNIDFEYSDDNKDCKTYPTSCDWYKSNLGALSTSTLPVSLKTTEGLTWTFASSSQGKAGVLGNNNRDLRIIAIPTPTRFVRAIFTVPIGSANAGVYAEILPSKELSE